MGIHAGMTKSYMEDMADDTTRTSDEGFALGTP